MKREEVKHGQKVKFKYPSGVKPAVELEFEVLERSAIKGHWFIHRRDENGKWDYRTVHPVDLVLIDNGAREPQLIGG